MDFKRYLDKAAAELDEEVGRIFKEQLIEAAKIDKKLIPLVKAFALACQGGKRIRGALVVLGYEIGKLTTDYRLQTTAEDGRQKTEDILKIGAAAEIAHTAILAHDDIIDKSLTRRDKPSLHQALGGDHYGISQAISLADYGFFLAIRIISEASFPINRKIQALELFSKVMMDTALGEMLDLEKTDPMTIMRLKTARYTIAGPLALGAILGGLGPTSPRFRRIKEFGENLGIAYQIRDDILDSEIQSIERGQKEVVKFTNKAIKVLPTIAKDKIMSKLLEQMAEYLVRRTK